MNETPYEMFKRVMTALSIASAPVRFKSKTFPDEFLVYYAVADGDISWYSGRSRRKSCRYSVSYYNRDVSALEDAFPYIHAALQTEGLIPVAGSGKDSYFDETGHYCRVMDYTLKTAQGGT